MAEKFHVQPIVEVGDSLMKLELTESAIGEQAPFPMTSCSGFYVHSEWEKRKSTETCEEFNKKNFDQVEKMMADPHVSGLVRDVKKLLDERFDPEHMDETKKEKYRAFEARILCKICGKQTKASLEHIDDFGGMMQPLSGADQVWLNAWDIIKDGQERFYIGENFENIFD